METAAPDPGLHPAPAGVAGPPLIFGNILQQLYNTIDAMVIGRFAGETAFAAIGVAGTVMNLFLFSSAAAAQASPSSLLSSMAAGIWPASGRRGFWPLSSAACSPWC